MAGLSLSLLLVAGVLAWVVLDQDPYVAPRPGTPATTASPARASQALADLESALASGDAEAAGQLAPQGDDAAVALLRSLADNARAARVRDLSLRYVTELGGVAADGTWSATVDVTWSFAGFDRGPSLAEVAVAFRAEGDRAGIVTIGGAGRRTPVWLSGPVEVRRGGGTLVLVRGSAATADRVSAVARAAVPVVERVLPDARAGLVVEVPAGVAGLHRALDAPAGTYDRIAAVTTSADGSFGERSPVHVFVNPAVFGDLERRGAQVVMSHEAVHVVTGATTGDALPLWLLEGFADYVALRDVPLPLSVTAEQVIERVRRDGPPAALPGPEDFDTRTPHLGASYEAAWLACRLLAQRGGEDALVRLYERVDDGVPLGRALRGEFGLTVRGLTTQWRDLLRDVAA